GGFVPMLPADGYDAVGIDPQAPDDARYQPIEFERRATSSNRRRHRLHLTPSRCPSSRAGQTPARPHRPFERRPVGPEVAGSSPVAPALYTSAPLLTVLAHDLVEWSEIFLREQSPSSSATWRDRPSCCTSLAPRRTV